MAQKRALGFGETYVKYCYDHANGTTCVVAMVQLLGPLTADLIKHGLALLQKRHPLLRAFFSNSDEKHDCFEVDEEPLNLPLNIAQRTNSEQWKEVYEQHLNEPFVKGKSYLWHATFLEGKREQTSDHEIVVSFHHSIIDGISLGYFFRDLLNYCAMIACGRTLQIETLPLLPSVEALEKKQITWPVYLKKSEIGFMQLLKMEKHLFSYERNVSLDRRRTKFICLETDEDDLVQMIDLSRKNRTTLTNLLSAALLMAVYRAKGPESRYVRLKQIATTPVDMRKNCHSISGAVNIGCFVSAATTMHSTDRNTSLWPFARSFQRKLKKAFEEQAYFPAEFDRPMYTEMLGGVEKGVLEQKFHLGVGVTNYGILDLPVHCGPFFVRGFYSGAARHWGDWLMLLHTASVGGKLFSCFCYEDLLLSKGTAEKIVQEFTAILPLSRVLLHRQPGQASREPNVGGSEEERIEG